MKIVHLSCNGLGLVFNSLVYSIHVRLDDRHPHTLSLFANPEDALTNKIWKSKDNRREETLKFFSPSRIIISDY